MIDRAHDVQHQRSAPAEELDELAPLRRRRRPSIFDRLRVFRDLFADGGYTVEAQQLDVACLELRWRVDRHMAAARERARAELRLVGAQHG